MASGRTKSRGKTWRHPEALLRAGGSVGTQGGRGSQEDFLMEWDWEAVRKQEAGGNPCAKMGLGGWRLAFSFLH